MSYLIIEMDKPDELLLTVPPAALLLPLKPANVSDPPCFYKGIVRTDEKSSANYRIGSSGLIGPSVMASKREQPTLALCCWSFLSVPAL